MAIKIVADDDIALDTGVLAADAGLHDKAVHALRNVYDPELPINIYDLGLIYGIALDEAAGTAHITMTLTAPNCPVAEELPRQAQAAVAEATGLQTTLKLTFDPPWTKDNLPLEAKLALGLL
jgi:FeS assembly SUF system protein